MPNKQVCTGFKGYHDRFKLFSTEIALKKLHQRYVHLYPYSSNVNKTVCKLHKIIRKRGVTFGRIPSNESKGIIKRI